MQAILNKGASNVFGSVSDRRGLNTWLSRSKIMR